MFDAIRERDIQVHVHYIPVCNQPYYRKLGFMPGYCPQAERYYSEAMTLPLHAELSDEVQQRVVDALREMLV